MKTFNIQAINYGFVTIKADTQEDALIIANEMGTDDFEWSGVDITGCEEEEDVKTRYYVCGIGYDEIDRITDYEQSFGDFDTYEEAYELFVKLQCKNAESFFTKASDLYQIVIQLEECEEYDGGSECVDVRNECWVVNPNF